MTFPLLFFPIQRGIERKIETISERGKKKLLKFRMSDSDDSWESDDSDGDIGTG